MPDLTPDDEELTAQLAEALFRIDTDRDKPGGLAGRSYDDVARALLPVVRRYGDQRAAEALRPVLDLAEELLRVAQDSDGVTAVVYRQNADRIRAAALRGEVER